MSRAALPSSLQSASNVTLLRDRAHYVGDGVYTMGSLSCAVCGQLFPLGTSPLQHAVCSNCHCAHAPRHEHDNDHAAVMLAAAQKTSTRTRSGARLRSATASTPATLYGSSGSVVPPACKAALLFTPAELMAASRRAAAHGTANSSSNDNTDDGDAGGDEDGTQTTQRGAGKQQQQQQRPSRQLAQRAGTTAVDHRVVEDAFCAKCGVHRPCRTYARQTRSADEGQTIFYQCTVCRAEWQENS